MKLRKFIPLFAIPFLASCGRPFAGSEGANIVDFGLRYINAAPTQWESTVSNNEFVQKAGALYTTILDGTIIVEDIDGKSNFYSAFTNKLAFTASNLDVALTFNSYTLFENVRCYVFENPVVDGYVHIFDSFGNTIYRVSGTAYNVLLEANFVPTVKIEPCFDNNAISIELFSPQKGIYIEYYKYYFEKGLGSKIELSSKPSHFEYSTHLLAPYDAYSYYYDNTLNVIYFYEYDNLIGSYSDNNLSISFGVNNIGRTVLYQYPLLVGTAEDASVTDYNYINGGYKFKLYTTAIDAITGVYTTEINLPYEINTIFPLMDSMGLYTLAQVNMEVLENGTYSQQICRIIDENLVLHDTVTENILGNDLRVGNSLFNPSKNTLTSEFETKQIPENYIFYNLSSNYLFMYDNETNLYGIFDDNFRVAANFEYVGVVSVYEDCAILKKNSTEYFLFDYKTRTISLFDMNKIDPIANISGYVYGELKNNSIDLKYGNKVLKQNLCSSTATYGMFAQPLTCLSADATILSIYLPLYVQDGTVKKFNVSQISLYFH